jgi:hypothetical protein
MTHLGNSLMYARHQPPNPSTIRRNITGTYLPTNPTGFLNPTPYALPASCWP